MIVYGFVFFLSFILYFFCSFLSFVKSEGNFCLWLECSWRFVICLIILSFLIVGLLRSGLLRFWIIYMFWYDLWFFREIYSELNFLIIFKVFLFEFFRIFCEDWRFFMFNVLNICLGIVVILVLVLILNLIECLLIWIVVNYGL